MLTSQAQRAIEQHSPGVRVAQEEADERRAHQQQRVGIVCGHFLEQAHALLKMPRAGRPRLGKHRRRAEGDVGRNRKLRGVVGPEEVEAFLRNGMDVGGSRAHARDHRVAQDAHRLEAVDPLDGIRRTEHQSMTFGHGAPPNGDEAVQAVDVDAELQPLRQLAGRVE